MVMRHLFIFFLAGFWISGPVYAAESFSQWLAVLKQEALQKGISSDIVNQALSDIQPIPRIIELDRKQPEGRLTFQQYKDRVINQDRIDKGRRLYREHKQELERASARYGVPPQVIVALWGIETSYGDNTGGFGVIPALATLAYDGRRSEFFRKELLSALQILDEGHIAHAQMKGSWAGAMGQNQFMPSSFHAYAVDGNGDGRRDIWTSLPDIFASTANYLSKNGWKDKDIREFNDGRPSVIATIPWGHEVKLPANFSSEYIGFENSRNIYLWQQMGVRLSNGQPIPFVNVRASVVLPDGEQGPAYLVTDNYRVIMKWNKSVYFATSVGILADHIAR